MFCHKAQGVHTLSPFSNISFSMVSSSLVPQKWLVMQGTSWTLSGQLLRVNQYIVLCMGSLSAAPLIMFSLPGVKCMFWCSSISVFSLCDGNQLRWSAKTFSFPGLYRVV